MGAPPPGDGAPGAPALRLDKWLWHARFAKSRAVAVRIVSDDGVRINGARAAKPSAPVRAGDVLTFALGPHVRVIRIVGIGARRGPATEAQTLYEDLAPPEPRARTDRPAAFASRDAGSGRPTKRERRDTDRLRDPD